MRCHFKVAGIKELQAACHKLSPINIGEAVITVDFRLPAQHIIHTVGPVYQDGKCGEDEKLRSCYLSSPALAIQHKCNSIAFPLISSGIYGFPKDKAFRIATSAIENFLQDNDMDVYLAVFDKSAFELSQKLIGEIDSYIIDNYINEELGRYRSHKLLPVDTEALSGVQLNLELSESQEFKELMEPEVELDDIIGKLDESFSQTLLRLIDAKGMPDIAAYKRANLDRKLFSKVRTGKGYVPSKRTAVAFVIALKLGINETGGLLQRAGFALSRSQKFDVIIEYFISNGKYDILEINEVLFHYD